MKITEILVDSFNSPLGIDSRYPTFSWKLSSTSRNTEQKAFQIRVYTADETFWDSGYQLSTQSIFNEYQGIPLKARTKYRVEVTVWDNYQHQASETTMFETGIFGGENFAGSWIGLDMHSKITGSPIFFTNFSSEKNLVKARLYISALGIYEVKLNQNRVGDAFFTPGWTNYSKRIQYQTYDITNFLQEHNKLEVMVGNGWYKGKLGFMPEPNHYGTKNAIIAEVQLEYGDGTQKIITSNKNGWEVTPSKIRAAEFYDGEDYDSTYKNKLVEPVKEIGFSKENLISQEDEYVKVVAKFPVKTIIQTPKGETVLDFGQNIAGFVNFKIEGFSGQKVKLRHAEALDQNGNFYTGNLSYAKAEDNYICDGTMQELHPHFTYHGFRYVLLEGFNDNNIKTSNFEAWALSTALSKSGSFETSNKDIAQLQSNIVWGQLDNFVDIPTDCPQRSERLGWTGDVSAFCHTAVFNRKADNFFKKWLRDLATDQNEKDGTPQVVPNIMQGQAASAFWGDVATILPWRLYKTYGNLCQLREHYPIMKDWVGYICKHTNQNGLWQDGYQYGDWLALDAEMQGLIDERNGATDKYLIANVFYLHSIELLINAAKELGNSEDEEHYRKLKTNVLAAFQAEYITSTGRLVSETQTACTLLLYFNLVPKHQRQRIFDTLIINLAEHKNHITTGFVGTPFICHVLSENGEHDLAGKILSTSKCPSWLYEVKMGATTIWERWDSILPDGSFNPKNMNSLNHYAYGSIGDWIYRKIGGLNELAPGYKKFELKPLLTQGFTDTKIEFESVYGTISCKLHCKDGKIKVAVRVPVNTTAIVYLPEKEKPLELGSGEYEYEYTTETNLESVSYSLETPLQAVLDNPVGRAFLEKEAPEIISNKMIEYIKNESLSSLLTYSASAKPLFERVVQVMNEAKID